MSGNAEEQSEARADHFLEDISAKRNKKRTGIDKSIIRQPQVEKDHTHMTSIIIFTLRI